MAIVCVLIREIMELLALNYKRGTFARCRLKRGTFAISLITRLFLFFFDKIQQRYDYIFRLSRSSWKELSIRKGYCCYLFIYLLFALQRINLK